MIIIKQENLPNSGLYNPGGPLSKKSEKRDKYLDLFRELRKSIEHEGYSDTNCNWRTRNNLKIGQIGAIQTTTLIRSARILKRILKT